MSIDTKIQEATAQFTKAVTDALREQLLESFGGSESTPKANGAPAKANGKTPKADIAHILPVRLAKKAKGGRLARRSPEEIAESVGKVQALLKKNPAGLRSEKIRTDLGLEPKEMPRILKQGIASKALKILSGSKRSTTYGVGKKP
jgi:hypothetical protein